jgi:mannosyl-oligosaccharide alpha-1,2-mannosidase
MDQKWLARTKRGLPRSFRAGRRRTVILWCIAVTVVLLLFRAANTSPTLPNIPLGPIRPIGLKQSNHPTDTSRPTEPSRPTKPKPPSREYDYVPTSYNWTSFNPWYPRDPSEDAPLPTGKPLPIPKIQNPFKEKPNAERRKLLASRRDEIKAAFEKSWHSYKTEAWLWDELRPISGGGKNTFGGLGASLVDSLDTLWMLDMKEDFYEGVAAVARMDFLNITGESLNMFETTIRHLGGLLSAYDLSGEKVLLRKATELGDLLSMGFDTPNHLPGFWLNFKDAFNGKQMAGSNDPSASPGSLSLEFTRLAQLTGESRYYSAVNRIMTFFEEIQNTTKLPGMWPVTVNFAYERAKSADFSLGGLADSLYEYLPKMHLLLGGLDVKYEKMYRDAIKVVEKHLLFRPMLGTEDDVLFSGDLLVVGEELKLTGEAQHLGCFVGGLFGLGSKTFDIPHHTILGDLITRGCVWGYSAFPHGIMPEIFQMIPCKSRDNCHWNETRFKEESSHSGIAGAPKGVSRLRDSRYLLRPEAFESLFVMYRVTGNAEYQDMAWNMFEAVRKVCETELAFAAVSDVTVNKVQQVDSMESFWMAETLKYLYLVFSPPDLISLDEFVFNTEAHPFRRPRA